MDAGTGASTKTETSPARRRRAGGDRRRAVLEAAVRVIAERGYEKTRFSDVAGASGVAVSTLQYYFGSREDMIVEAFRQECAVGTVLPKGTVDEEPDPWRRLVGLVDISLARDERSMLGWRVLLEFWRAATRDPELMDEAHRLYERWRAPFAEAVEDGVRAGAFDPRRDPDAVVAELLAKIEGIAVAMMLGYPRVDFEALRDGAVDDLASVLGLALPTRDTDN